MLQLEGGWPRLVYQAAVFVVVFAALLATFGCAPVPEARPVVLTGRPVVVLAVPLWGDAPLAPRLPVGGWDAARPGALPPVVGGSYAGPHRPSWGVGPQGPALAPWSGRAAW